MKKRDVSDKLNDFFGDKTVTHRLDAKEFLANLSKLYEQQNKDIKEAFGSSDNKTSDKISALIDENKKTRQTLEALHEAVRANRVDHVEVTNFPEYPKQKEVKIPEYPKEINIKKPSWYEKFVPDTILKYIKEGFEYSTKQFEAALDRHTRKENAFAVRLVDKKGDNFYDAMLTAVAGGVNTSDLVKEVTIQSVLTSVAGDSIDVNIIGGAGSGGTASVDDADFTAGTTSGTPAMGVYESTPSSVTDGDIGIVGITADRRLKVETGLSTQTDALTDTELRATAVPVSGVVTANLSATDNAVLDAIAASVAAIDTDATTLIGHVDGIEGLLTTIDADTGAMVTDLAAIETLLTTIEGNQLADGHSVDTELTTADLDTGAGADTRAVVGLVGSKSGGGELIPGSATDGLLVNLGANNDVVVTATDLDIRPLVNTDVVTAELSAVDNAVLDTIDAVLDTIKVDTEAIETAVEALQAGQLADGHNVTIDNAAGASAVNIQDGGNIITVDGTVTANLSATDNAVLDTIDAVLDAINAKLVTGTVIGDVNLGATDNAVLDDIASKLGVIDNIVSGSEAQVDVVTSALPTGAATAANQQTDALTDTELRATDVDVAPQAKTSGGATPYKLISAATTNATSVKGSAGQVYSVQVYNNNAEERFLKFYNKASAPTVGTDTPVKVIMIPGATTGAGSNFATSVGIEFTTGIAFALTTGVADSDTGAVAANEIMCNIDYK